MPTSNSLITSITTELMTFRVAAFFALVSIHQHGVSHGDFAGRNVIQSTAEDGSVSVKLVDFERGKEHVCAFDFDQKIELYDKAPIIPPCKCHEIYTAGEEAAIWRPGKLPCMRSVCVVG